MQGPTQERLKKESKMHLSTKVRLVSKSTIWHFWSAKRHFQSAEWHLFGLWPNFLRVPIRHILFDFFAEKCVLIRILLIVSYFLSILVSINGVWISKFSTLFYALRGRHFLTLSNFSYFWFPLWYSLKLGFLGFKDNCINFLEP